jgi:hypothetical protein
MGIFAAKQANLDPILAADINYVRNILVGVTSFPGSPTTGERCWRSDRGIEYYYDGTRWLSTELFHAPVIGRDAQGSGGLAQGTHVFDIALPYYEVGGIYLGELVLNIFFLTAQSGSAYYSFNYSANTAGGVNSAITTPGTTAAYTTGSRWYSQRTAVNAVLNSTYFSLQLIIQVGAGAPGAFFLNGSQTYRLIG